MHAARVFQANRIEPTIAKPKQTRNYFRHSSGKKTASNKPKQISAKVVWDVLTKFGVFTVASISDNVLLITISMAKS